MKRFLLIAICMTSLSYAQEQDWENVLLEAGETAKVIELNSEKVYAGSSFPAPSAYIPMEVLEAEDVDKIEEYQKKFFDKTVRKLVRTNKTPKKVKIYYNLQVPNYKCVAWNNNPGMGMGPYWGGPWWGADFYYGGHPYWFGAWGNWSTCAKYQTELLTKRFTFKIKFKNARELAEGETEEFIIAHRTTGLAFDTLFRFPDELYSAKLRRRTFILKGL
jgi:hypothetical protein